MRRLSIRAKLTLWYGGVLALVLAAFGTAVYWTMRHQALGRIDRGLDEELTDVVSELRRAPDEKALSAMLERRFADHEGFDFQITRPSGARFFVNKRLERTSLPLPNAGRLDAPAYRTVSSDQGSRWRSIEVQVPGPSEGLRVQVARSLHAFDRESHELLVTFLLLGPLTLVIAVGGGYFLARRALAPVNYITRTANEITADQLSRRIDVPNPDDELGALAQTLNRMIQRLEQSFAEMRRFTADAAHELRTPLAVMRNEAEVALRTPRPPEEYSRVLENVLEDVNRLSNIAEQLLFLSRQDAGLQPVTREEVAVDDLLRDVIGNMQVVAHEKLIEINLGENEPCRLLTDARQLRRVLYNLLDNAIKYTAAPGHVTVSGIVSGDGWTFVVSDTGMGIAPEHLPHVFERFYRADPARTGDGTGAGLGLAICRSLVSAMGGTIALESTVGHGTTASVRLPILRSSDR